MDIQSIFLVGFIIFLSAVLYWTYYKKQNDLTKISRLVFFTTATSYGVLISGLWLINSPFNEVIYPTRWLFYILSCSLLMFEIGIILNKTNLEKIEMVVLNALVMLTGFLASITLSPLKWVFFILSSLIFFYLLKIINQKSGKQTDFMNKIRCFVKITWTLFPVVWLLAPTGFGLLTALTTAFLYLLLDITTKIVFSYYAAKGKF